MLFNSSHATNYFLMFFYKLVLLSYSLVVKTYILLSFLVLHRTAPDESLPGVTDTSFEPFSKCHLLNPITLHLYRKEPHFCFCVCLVMSNPVYCNEACNEYHNTGPIGIVSINFPVSSEWLELCTVTIINI